MTLTNSPEGSHEGLVLIEDGDRVVQTANEANLIGLFGVEGRLIVER